MAASINHIHIQGHVGRDPEMKGAKMAQFSIATNDGWGDNKKTNWHTIKCFGQKTDYVMGYIRKGCLVYVSGEIDYYQTEKDGMKVTYTSIKARDVQIVSSKDAAPLETSFAGSSKGSAVSLDDLPF